MSHRTTEFARAGLRRCGPDELQQGCKFSLQGAMQRLQLSESRWYEWVIDVAKLGVSGLRHMSRYRVRRRRNTIPAMQNELPNQRNVRFAGWGAAALTGPSR
eukprot:6420303-Karenia_brevis.AAC.1